MKGLILSGGKGTRLYPLTYTRAKQLIPVANKPVLFRVIEAIRDAGVEEIGIVIGDTGPQVREAVGDGSQFGNVRITYIEQDAPAGLAHAVKISQEFLGNERFVMFLGDNVLQGGISELIKDFGNHPEWNGQIVLTPVREAQYYGVAKLRENGSIEYLVEKPADPPSNLALVGIYMFDPNIFKAVHAIKPSKRGELEITDAIQWLIENGYVVFPHVHRGWWIDTGKPHDMLDANGKVLDELVPVIKGYVDASSLVDDRVTIEEGAEVINSVIRGPAIIGKNSRIVNSFIGPFTSIYYNVVVENSELERCLVLEHCRISNVPVRIQDSLIGRYADVGVADSKPHAYKMVLGDYSQVRLLK
ncbi:MAG: glucose-1-phosphate thymidylyltransferase [Chloroflexota bacterium]|nr:glucose-1-phosphate thymidylyltransferase [Chloroflexota bacterium]NOG65090.1 glucose-1-phosphate thymidylyltransferase [Chloroflexota bacterium]GIK65281.1 MAG: glucose-1-phosphate thymidylyltransferase [Chloroflexota bacterium]